MVAEWSEERAGAGWEAGSREGQWPNTDVRRIGTGHLGALDMEDGTCKRGKFHRRERRGCRDYGWWVIRMIGARPDLNRFADGVRRWLISFPAPPSSAVHNFSVQPQVDARLAARVAATHLPDHMYC